MPPMNQQPKPGDSRNMIVAVVLSMLVLVLWWVVVPPNAKDQQQAQQQAQANATTPTAAPSQDAGYQHMERAQALSAEGPRVTIANAQIDGSIRLKGARFDDIGLKNYRTTIDPKSPEIDLLVPVGVNNPYFAEFGWTADPGAKLRMPDKDSEWQVTSGTTLSTGAPVTLSWDNGAGLIFTRTIEIDADTMIGVTDAVENKSGAAVKLYPFGQIVRGGVPWFHPIWVVHQGMIGVMNGTLHEEDYDGIVKEGERVKATETTGGWLGFTDHYFMASLVPDQNEPVTATFKATNEGSWELFTADFLYKTGRDVAPGASTSVKHRLFAGAKVVALIDRYADEGVTRFDMAVDWGWFFFLTKPIFLVLDWVYGIVGNFGVAILILTVLLKA